MRRAFALAPLTLFSMLAACSEEPLAGGLGPSLAGDDAGVAPDSGTGACVVDPLDAQPRSRFPVGRTFYLPRLDPARPGCESAAWSLREAPVENQNVLVQGGDGYARFTPHVAGEYRFTEAVTGQAQELTAVDAGSLSFANYNYAPSHSLALVGGEVWAANVYGASVSRLGLAPAGETGRVAVGGWPVALAHAPGSAEVLVAQRADDTLGFVDVASGRLVDAVWVGDEPACVTLSADGATAYVTLATEDAVAVVDVAARSVVARWPAPRDPYAVVRSGDRLVVAGHRTSQSDQWPFASFDVQDEIDIMVLDAQTGERLVDILEVGTTINDLLPAPDGSGFYFARVQNPGTDAPDQSAGLAWSHQLAFFDFASNEITRSADLGRQPTSAGFAVTLHSMALARGSLFVTAEASDVVLRLDPSTLEEVGRTEVGGRPRHLLASAEGELFVHGPQGLVVSRLGADGTLVEVLPAGSDPRDAELATGQYYFTGTGDTFGENHGCNSCHADGLSDGVVWNVGTGEEFNIPRPFFWLEGTRPLGWGGYMSSAQNFGYETQINIGRRPNTEQARSVGRYIASILPPPAANGYTRRDGSLSDEGLLGKEVFDTRGGCLGCHSGPTKTNGQLFDPGVTELPSDVPSLVGIYRMPGFLKTGQAATLEDALDRMLAWLSSELSEADRAAVLRYLRELTARELFVLRGPDEPSDHFPVDIALDLHFSLPVYDAADNLAQVRLLDATGAPVAVSVQRVPGDSQQLHVVPEAPLAYDASYTLEVAQGLEGEGEQRLAATFTQALHTAQPPSLQLPAELTWTVDMPGLDPDTGTFTDETREVQFALTATAKASGAEVVVDYGGELTYPLYAIVDGTTLRLLPLPVAAGPAFVDGTPSTLELVDEDGDGVADRADGSIVLRGPGLYADTPMSWVAGALEEPEPPPPPPGTGSGVLGDSCDADAQCGAEAPFCAIQPGQALGFCTTTGCTTDADCEPSWTCFDLSVFVPGAEPFCNRP